MTLTENQKKWRKFIEEKLKKARMGKIMRKNSEILAMMIAATVKMYTDVGFNLSNMAESIKDIMDDPVFQRIASDPRAVAEYLQSPGTVIKASHKMKHLFLESMENSEQFVESLKNGSEEPTSEENSEYITIADGSTWKMETSENLGEWVNVSKVGKNQDPPVQKKEKAEKEDAGPKEGKVEKELTMEEWALTL